MKRKTHPGIASDDSEALPTFLAKHVAQCRYFFFKPSAFAMKDLAFPCGGWEQCAGNYSVRRRSFEYFALEYVAKGIGSYTCQGITTELRTGALFAYSPGIPHIIATSSKQPLLKYFVDFSGPRAKRIFRSLPLNKGYVAWIRQPHVVQDLLDQIVAAGQDSQALAPRLCTSLFEVLLLRIAQNAMPDSKIACRAYETYAKASHELRSNFRSIVSVAMLAEKLQITPAYLSRLFQRYSNTNPHATLMALKMAEAASLLVTTNANVIHIAAHIGFSDPYHFSRVFKAFYGSSPANFRSHPRSLANQGI